MCGIIGWLSPNKKITVQTLLKYVEMNEKRGADDGMGIVDLSVGRIKHTILKLKELNAGAVSTVNRKKDEMEALAKNMERFLSKHQSGAIFCHHRKASAGVVSMKNTHPIYSEGHFYLHNGSASDYRSLGKFLELIYSKKRRTETDTETVAEVCNLLEELGKPPDEIVEILSEMFSGFGVLIKLNLKKKTIEIYKDMDRSLFILKKKEGHLLISEPTSLDFDSEGMTELLKGYMKITIDKNGKPRFFKKRMDYVDIPLDALPRLEKYIKNGWTRREAYNCDGKDCTKLTTYSWRMPGTVRDYCISCWLEQTFANKDDSDDKKTIENFMKEKNKKTETEKESKEKEEREKIIEDYKYTGIQKILKELTGGFFDDFSELTTVLRKDILGGHKKDDMVFDERPSEKIEVVE